MKKLTKLLPAVVLLLAGVLLTSCKLHNLNLGYNKGYAPDQPLPFSHKLHAGQYQIDCRYCHSQVEKSGTAGVPSLNVCMNCHMVVKANNSPYIKKLSEAYEKGESIEWVRVHLLPDHARFYHAVHVNKLKKNQDISCTHCHGPVETMDKIIQHETLSMGMCVNCHRANDTGAQGPLNCTSCHY